MYVFTMLLFSYHPQIKLNASFIICINCSNVKRFVTVVCNWCRVGTHHQLRNTVTSIGHGLVELRTFPFYLSLLAENEGALKMELKWP